MGPFARRPLSVGALLPSLIKPCRATSRHHEFGSAGFPTTTFGIKLPASKFQFRALQRERRQKKKETFQISWWASTAQVRSNFFLCHPCAQVRQTSCSRLRQRKRMAPYTSSQQQQLNTPCLYCPPGRSPFVGITLLQLTHPQTRTRSGALP